jgi:hypothetical protein
MKRMTFKGSAIVSLGLAFAPLAASAASLKSLDAVMLIPRPPPPKDLVAHISHGDEVMLNPQPLPPKVFKSKQIKSKLAQRTWQKPRAGIARSRLWRVWAWRDQVLGLSYLI